MTEQSAPDLLRMLLQLEDLPSGYRVSAELHTEEDAEADAPESVEGRALDARSVEYTSEDGQRVLQASVFLNADADAATARVSDILPEEPDSSDPHVVRMDTQTDLPDIGANAIAATHVVEKDDEQAIIHIVSFSEGLITAALVLWDLTEELEIEDSIDLAKRFSTRVRAGLA